MREDAIVIATGDEHLFVVPWLPPLPTWSGADDHMALRRAHREATLTSMPRDLRRRVINMVASDVAISRSSPNRLWEGVVGQSVAVVRKWSFRVIEDEQHDDRNTASSWLTGAAIKVVSTDRQRGGAKNNIHGDCRVVHWRKAPILLRYHPPLEEDAVKKHECLGSSFQ